MWDQKIKIKPNLNFWDPCSPLRSEACWISFYLVPMENQYQMRGRVQRLGARSTRSRYGWDIWTRKVHGVIWRVQRYKGQTTYFFESADLLILQNVYIFAHISKCANTICTIFVKCAAPTCRCKFPSISLDLQIWTHNSIFACGR